MTISPIDKIINEAQDQLSTEVKTQANIPNEKIHQVFQLGKTSFIRLLESEAGAGHFEEFLKVYNGIATTFLVSQIVSLLEYFYTKQLRDNLSLSDMNAGKVSKIVASFLIQKISHKKNTAAQNIKIFCTQMGLEECISNLETLKERWDSLSPAEKEQLSR